MVRSMTHFVLLAALGLAACGDAEMDELPEVGELERDRLDGQLEFDEELVLGPGDVRKTIMATGWVEGTRLPNGFFLRTEGKRMIFVETDRAVTPDSGVRVVGPLVAADAAVFEGWERDAFDAGFDAEWDVETALYIDATVVTPM